MTERVNEPIFYEIADVEPDGSYGLLGEFRDRDAAIAAAFAECGPGEYAGSADPRSGHYEDAITIHADGTATVR